MQAVETIAPSVGIKAACEALGISRSTLYRQKDDAGVEKKDPTPSARALSTEEREQVLDTLHCDRFIDKAPRQVYATLLDEGQYLCSVRTMYRILEDHGEVKERRDQLSPPVYQKPELLATAPNQVWSWDITKLLGPAKWTYFHLYVIMDIFSRYVVGWLVADREAASLAQALIEQTCQKQSILPGQLTIHADRGSSMTSKPVAFLLADLGITKTHSRPHTSNDNPFSESQFKTLKHRPDFPDRFASIEEAEPFAAPSLLGATRNTATAASTCLSHTCSITARPSRYYRIDNKSCSMPTRLTRSALSGVFLFPVLSPKQCGSIRHPQRVRASRRLLNF